jgi:glutaredoxin
MPLPEIIVYSKPDCCLCDKVKVQLKKLQASHQFAWCEINILDDPSSFKRFQHEIPVIFVNGQEAFKYRLDEDRFVHLLQAAGDGRRPRTKSMP